MQLVVGDTHIEKQVFQDTVVRCEVTSSSKTSGKVVHDCPTNALGQFVTWRAYEKMSIIICEIVVIGRKVGKSSFCILDYSVCKHIKITVMFIGCVSI